jgi:hypothetical protein
MAAVTTKVINAGERFQPYRSPISSISPRARYEMARGSMWNERSTHDAHFRDLADYISPRRPRFFTADRNRGDRRNQKIIDSTATFARRTLQSGMHAGMTSPARPWMRLLTPDPDLNEYGSVKEWLHIVTQRLLTMFGQTNLYNGLPVHYGDMGTFATAATAILDDDQDLFRCYNYPIGSYAIATNRRGLVDQWVYESQKTVLEIVDEYLVDRDTNMIDWSKASRALRNMWDQANYNAKVDVCWLVMPNLYRHPGALEAERSMPYQSVHIEKGQENENTFLRVKGFNEFPVMVSRWDVTGDDWWGTDCPGMVALGDTKQLQTGERRSAQAIEKMLNPPLQAPAHVRNQKASLLPGDITYVDVREGQKGIHPIHEMNFAIDQHEGKQNSTRDRIRRAWYEDLFLMLAYSDNQRGVQPPTATEIAERHEEKLIALGPVLERTNDELLDPMVDRIFAMADRAGLIPIAPPELHGMKLRVEYTSIMAQAQKLVGVVAHERFLQQASAMMQLVPSIKHKIRWFQAVDDSADQLGVNPKLVVPDDEAYAAAEQENKALQVQQAAVAMKDASGAAANLGRADLENDNVLKRIVEGVQ